MEFLALPGLIFFVYAVFSFSRNPHQATIWILIFSVINAWFIQPPSVSLGLNVYLQDLVFLPLLFTALFRIGFKREWAYVSVPWLICGLIVFYQLIVGLKLYGTAAGVDFRNIFYYWAGTLYFMTFAYSKEMIDKVAKYWVLICAALLLIVYFRFVAESLHLPIAQTWIADDPTGVKFRVVKSEKAYLLGVVVLMLFHRYVMPDAAKPSRMLTVLFVLAVIVLQHRSVWGATIFGVSTLFLLPSVKKHKVIGKLSVLGVLGVLLLLPLMMMGYLDNFIESIGGSAERATNLSTGTFGARMNAWEQIMQYWTKQDFMHQFLGDPFGGSYAGLPNSPHNFFFQSLLRVGVLGNFIISIFYIGLLVRLYFGLLKDHSHNFYPTLFFMLIVAQMAFYIPYAPQAEHGIILGIAASLAKRKLSDQQPKPQTAINAHLLKPPTKSPITG